MACIYTYKGKQYSESEIKDIVFKEEVNPTDIKFATLNDLANLLAYTNSKIILPGNSVEYTTPDNQKFSTYQEASNYITKLTKNIKEIDLDNININKAKLTNINEIPTDYFTAIFDEGWSADFIKIDGVWYIKDEYTGNTDKADEFLVLQEYNKLNSSLNDFIEKNKQYEQSKEIIETWKKENNIVYNPEEVYSRGQGFYSSIGAYSTVELDLLLQNLLQHIEDNKKAGGEFNISAFTKPVEKRIGHLEGESSVRFVIYPKSEDIKWAAPTDVYSGSVWDAAEKVSKDKKSELLGVSHTKYPSLNNVNEVSPNLASIIDERSHHHNELGIKLTPTNFRLEYDETVPYEIKKLVNSVNSILDSKYGKLVKPDIKNSNKEVIKVELSNLYETKLSDEIFNTEQDAKDWIKKESEKQDKEYEELDLNTIYKWEYKIVKQKQGIQPTQTKENTTSIESVKKEVLKKTDYNYTEKIKELTDYNYSIGKKLKEKGYVLNVTHYEEIKDSLLTTEQIKEKYELLDLYKKGVEALDKYRKNFKPEKEYTEQALINTKIAKLKEIAKKYPRSLITSKVINNQQTERQYQKSNLLNQSYFKLNTKEDIRLLEKAETELLKEKIKEKSVLNINKNKIKFDNTSKQSNENLHEFKQQIGILISLFKEKGVNINLIEDKNEQSNEEGSVKQDKKNGDFIVTYSEPTGEVISHEILHIFVDMLGYNHPIVKKGIEQALKTQGAIELINLYKKKVPGKKESYYEKELLVTLAGQKAEEVMRDNPSGIPKWKFWVNQFFRKIGEIFGIERDYIKEIFEKMYSGSGIIKDFEFSEDEYLKIKNENPYKKYELFFHRRIRDIDEQILKNREKGTDTSELEQKKLLIMRTMVQYRNGSVESLKELGKATIDEFGKFLDKVEKGEVKMTNKNVIYVKNVIDTWKNFDDFSSVVSSYYKRIYPYLISWAIKDASEVSNKKITEEDIENDNVDIAWNEANFGTLVNVENILGYTVGKKIKIAQNKVTTLNREFSKKMKHHIKNLKDYAKSNGMSLDEVYDLFTIEYNSTLWLTAPLEEGNVAEAKRKYDIIMNNENLRSFYSFLLDFNRRSNNILLTDKTISPLFFPNMKKGGMKDSLLKIIGIGKKNVDLDKIYQESTSFDELPIQFLKNLTPSQKERDLEKVFTYYAYWLNNYNVMSNLLPELRIIQDVIDYRYDDRVNEIIPRQYYSSMNKNKTIDGVNTNLHKIVDSYIDMQVKGKMKKEELKKEFITNAEQNEILTFNGAQVIDNLLMLNSLLRIGLSPITALANVGFGEISNILEGFGGRFYSLSDLRSATNIFFSQVTNKDLSSMDEKDIPLLYKLNDKLNFLQELDDYESLTESGIGKKITKEKAMELMYSWQKKGEWFLQARTALAVLIHDGYLTKDGKETDKYKNATEEELESLGDKIQGINGYIHGRYSQREASIMHQYVLFRVLGQFKKWIPAAYERRFQGRRFNRRLGFETEGSYITFGRVVLKEIFLKGNIADGLMNMIIPLMGYKKALESGKLTELEIYNMRRLMLEIVLTTSLILSYASLYGDDDDKERRKRDPWIKFSLLLLDRISGDIEFWYNPSEWLRTVTNASLSRVVSDLLFVLNPIHWHYLFYLGDWEYKRGSRKGENKSWSRIRRTIPGLKSFEDIKRITSKYTLEELQKPSINEIKKFIED